MNTHDHDYTFIAKNAALKINFHNFEVFFQKKIFKVWQPFRKTEHFCDILRGKLVNVSWGVILKICLEKTNLFKKLKNVRS